MKQTIKVILLGLFVICLTVIPVMAKADPPYTPVPSSSDTFNWSMGDTITNFELKHEYISKDDSAGWSRNLLIYYICVDGNNKHITYVPDGPYWKAYEFGSVDIAVLAGSTASQIDNYITNFYYPYFWVDEIPDDDTPSFSASHTHNWVYGIIYEATEDTDGLEGEYCLCGATRNTSVVPAGNAIINNNYAKINAAKAGQTIVLEMKTMCNLSNEFMNKLAARNNCSFTIRLKYKNKLYEFYIPAGTVFDTSLPYYGPEKLMEMFEYKEL